MAETVGTITNIKLISWTDIIDAGAITILESATGNSWMFYLWLSRNDAPALTRVLDTQRLALAREAAVRKLPVHVFHDAASQIIFELTVDIP